MKAIDNLEQAQVILMKEKVRLTQRLGTMFSLGQG